MHSGYYATWVTDMLPTTQLPTNWKISVPEDLPAAWLDFEYYLDGVLVAPIAEEIIFRWFLIGKAKKRAWAILLSAVLFSTVHLNSKNYLDLDTQLYFQAIYLPIGLAYTFLYLRYGLVYSIAAHALSNTYLLLVKLYPTPTKTAALIFMLLGLVLFFRKIIKSQRS
jgi:membrane protease YdiL (CAAX protease family)